MPAMFSLCLAVCFTDFEMTYSIHLSTRSRLLTAHRCRLSVFASARVGGHKDGTTAKTPTQILKRSNTDEKSSDPKLWKMLALVTNSR